MQPSNDLGRFEPPKNYEFEPEFQEQPPRSIPAELRLGRYARGKRKAVWGFLVAGAICLISSLLPIVRTWGLYLLPLQYLLWIGIGCFVISVLQLISYFWSGGPYRYVKEGMPMVARIHDLALRVKTMVNGQPQTYQFVARIEYQDPTTGQLSVVDTPSNDISAMFKESLTTSYKVGDYATAVYLTSDPAKTLRLYGFLDLRPDLGVVRRDARPEGGLVQTVLLVCLLFGFFGALFWNVYAYSRYAPVETSFSQLALPFAIGALILGAPLLAFVIGHSIREEKKRRKRNEEALARGEPIELESGRKRGWFGGYGILIGLVLIAGTFLLGGGTMLCWCFTANALLDSSPGQLRPVAVDDLIMRTHKFIFREYLIKYHFLDEKEEKREFLSAPDHISQFNTNLAIAEVHSGYFGWPWVKDLKPVKKAGRFEPGNRQQD
jgi:hypothetical protein